ncbi:capsid and scaffold protein [Bacillus phage SP8]|nr:capsid and scaffold protein [Bacillus phage SP8]
MPLTRVSIGMYEKETTSVKDLGAKGDGTTDDTEAVQKALDAGGDIVFPSGTYLVGSLQLRSNSRIIGLGKVVIKYLVGAGYFTNWPVAMVVNENLPAYYAPSNSGRQSGVFGVASNITISNITFDGQGQSVYGVQFVASDNVYLDNVKIINTKGALDLRAVRDSHFYRVVCDNIAEDGISISDQNFKPLSTLPVGKRSISNNIVFEYCEVRNSCGADRNDVTMNAFELDDGPANIRYVNCRAVNNTGCGFEGHIHTNEYDMYNIVFENCYAYNNHRKDDTITRYMSGFQIGQCPEGSYLGDIKLIGCHSIENDVGFSGNPGAETGYKQNLTITGGVWRTKFPTSTTRDQYNSVIALNSYFKNVNITDVTLEGTSDGYGIYTYGNGEDLFLRGVVIKNVYAPLRFRSHWG